MYQRLKNILGVSLMVLAIVVSQISMPEAQAKIIKEMPEVKVDDVSAHVVTFSMNGGTFRGSYNSYSFQNKTPVLVIDDGKAISSFPDDKFASYFDYKTEANTWYTERECLTKYDTGNSVTKSITLYKKWYNITSDGTTLAAEGFHISADGTVLYRYDGEEKLVEIPQTVTTIADDAFDALSQNVRGIVLPAGIERIGENAFRGVDDTNIIYIFDSGTAASKSYGKQLAEKYEQLVYSEYLDPKKTEEIVGINYLSDTLSEETSPTEETSITVTSTVTSVKPDQKYTVTFETNISDVADEQREASSEDNISHFEEKDKMELGASSERAEISASAPKSTQHIKDSTPKTGDPLQYRMLIVYAIFSVGVLIVLTGNGKKKRFFAF